MADETPGGPSQADDPARTSQADNAGSPADADETLSMEEARKLRKEAAALRKRRTELEAELLQHRNAGLSELEKSQKRIAELEAAQTQAAEERKVRAVERLLAGAQYPDLLVGKVDLSGVELDEEGTVRHGDKLVAKLQSTYPALWSAGSADGGATGSGSGAFDMNAYIRRRAGRR